MEIVQSKWEQSHGDDPQDFGGRTVKKKYCGLDPAISMSISTTYGSIFQIPHYTHAPVQKNANVAFASCQVVDRALISSVDFDYSKSCLSNLADILIRVLEVSTKKMDNHVLEPSLYVIKGIAILDNDGKRILAKYYDPNTLSTAKEQKVFEKNLFNKTHRANTEIIMLENMTCVYKSNVDLYFYVMGSSHENELILVSVLNCLYDSISQILRKNVEKRSLMENLDVVMLALDEICDSGIILESDPTAISYRVALRNDDIPIGEQTVAQVLQSAKEQLKWSLLK